MLIHPTTTRGYCTDHRPASLRRTVPHRMTPSHLTQNDELERGRCKLESRVVLYRALYDTVEMRVSRAGNECCVGVRVGVSVLKDIISSALGAASVLKDINLIIFGALEGHGRTQGYHIFSSRLKWRYIGFHGSVFTNADTTDLEVFLSVSINVRSTSSFYFCLYLVLSYIYLVCSFCHRDQTSYDASLL
jgi:hypothetical protein